MAYKLIWSPAARDDLHDIVIFIARDNPSRAMSFGYELISQTDWLREFAELGRVVPESGTAIFAKSFFVLIESSTELIRTISGVTSHGFGILHAGFRNYKK
jgi:plasmid stabilization system protein ParE